MRSQLAPPPAVVATVTGERAGCCNVTAVISEGDGLILLGLNLHRHHDGHGGGSDSPQHTEQEHVAHMSTNAAFAGPNQNRKGEYSIFTTIVCTDFCGAIEASRLLIIK